MTLQELTKNYISIPEIARECGVDIYTAHNWVRYHGYLSTEDLFGKPVVHRTDFERFKREHPELIKTPQETAAQ